jgi:hypothetical protein
VADYVDLALRVEARRRGRAVRASGTQIRRIQPHARVIAFVGMAGEHATIHAAHVGRFSGKLKFFFCADPRERDSHAQMLCKIADEVEHYIDWCDARDEMPQIFVTSPGVVRKLDAIADRLPYVPIDQGAPQALQGRARRLRGFGAQLAFFTRYSPRAGQQVLLTATQLLSEHFITGQDDHEDVHLGAQLAWVAPPRGKDAVSAAEIAERTPMGANTDPEFDTDVLIDAVAAHNRARRDGAAASRVRALRDAIGSALEPVTLEMATGIRRAVELVRDLGLPELPRLDGFVERDRVAFRAHRAHVGNGGRLPLADRPKGAAFEYLNREDAEQQWASTLLDGDPVHRALARLRGTIISGTVTATADRRDGRRTIHSVTIASNQTLLRVRRGDELCSMDDPRLKFVVTRATRASDVTIDMEVTAGMRAVGVPMVGDQLDLSDGAPSLDAVMQQRIQLSKRLRTMPVTHADAPLPPVGTIPVPRRDPVAAVEALR